MQERLLSPLGVTHEGTRYTLPLSILLCGPLKRRQGPFNITQERVGKWQLEQRESRAVVGHEIPQATKKCVKERASMESHV